MKLTVHTDYALRTLIYLGLHQHELTTTQKISAAYCISNNHLQKVVQELVRLNLVVSTRGRTGGIRLNKKPSQINIGKAARAIESTDSLIECFSAETNTCPIINVCKLKGILRQAQEAFYRVLDEYTLEDIIKNPTPYTSLLNIKLPN